MQYCIVSLFVASAFMLSTTLPLWGHDPVGDAFYIATAKKARLDKGNWMNKDEIIVK